MEEAIEETSTIKQIAMGELTKMTTTVSAFSNTLDAIEIEDETSLATIGDLVKFAKIAKFKLDDKRKSLVDPLNKVVKEINALFKPTGEKIAALIAAAQKKMNEYAAIQQTIKDAEAAVIREEAAAEEREAKELADRLLAAAGEDAEPTAAAVIEVAEKNVEIAAKPAKQAIARGETSTVSTRQDWVAHVLDLKLLALAVGEGKLPLDCIQASQSGLNIVSRETKKNREEHGLEVVCH